MTAVEYGLLAALITIACLVALSAVGDAFNQLWTNWVIPALAALLR